VTSRAIARFVGLIVGALAGLEYALFILTSVKPGSSEAVQIVVLCSLAGAIFGFIGLEYATIRPFRWIESRLRSTPLPDLAAAIGGLLVGLVLAALTAYFLRDLPFGLNFFVSAAVALLFGYWGVTVGLGRRDEVIALVTGRSMEGTQRMILDTSAVIDGRIADIANSGFLTGILVAPHFMLAELQAVADSNEPIRRQRGRRGLEILDQLRKMPGVVLEANQRDYPEIEAVDHKLLRLARDLHASIITTDYNLNRVAQIEGVRIQNINDLANALKPAFVPGEEMNVTPIKEGKEPGQGIGYLPDGTMVVVDGGRDRLGQSLLVTVTSVIQTAAGRMIFASPSAATLGDAGSGGAAPRAAARVRS
jgi:uncharacterized protein YacL